MQRADLLGGTSRRQFVGRGAMLVAGILAWPAAAAAQSKMSKAQANTREVHRAISAAATALTSSQERMPARLLRVRSARRPGANCGHRLPDEVRDVP